MGPTRDHDAARASAHLTAEPARALAGGPRHHAARPATTRRCRILRDLALMGRQGFARSSRGGCTVRTPPQRGQAGAVLASPCPPRPPQGCSRIASALTRPPSYGTSRCCAVPGPGSECRVHADVCAAASARRSTWCCRGLKARGTLPAKAGTPTGRAAASDGSPCHSRRSTPGTPLKGCQIVAGGRTKARPPVPRTHGPRALKRWRPIHQDTWRATGSSVITACCRQCRRNRHGVRGASPPRRGRP